MKKTGAWIKAMRLRTLPLALSTVLTGSFMAFSESHFKFDIFILTFFTIIFLQILSNLANDYGDALKGTDNENRVGPERSIQSGAISAEEMKKGIILFVLLSFLTGVLLLFIAFGIEQLLYILLFLILGLGAIAAAIKYTVGKNAYGYSGLGDLFVFIFFGNLGVIGTSFLFTKSFEMILFLPALTIGLLSVAVLNMNNMRDIINDKACGKNTIVVKMGFENAKIYQTLLILLALIAWLFTGISFGLPNLFYVSLLPFIVLTIHILKVWKTKEPKLLDSELKKIAISTFLISALSWISFL